MKLQAGEGSQRPAAAQLRNIEVEFDVRHGSRTESRRALDGVSIDVNEGEILVLVGHSGCGKTTVLNLLAGLIDSTSGSIEVYGRSPIEARGDIGYMFARDALLPWRTAQGNVEYAMELRAPQLNKLERRERALRALNELGLGTSASLYPWQLSQGMRQRVAIARTWAIEPRLLLMDEPFAALDAQTRASAQSQFLDLWAADRRTVVFVTHEINEAILLADRILVMASGRIVSEELIGIPRPRNAETLVHTDSFLELHGRLTSSLHSVESSAHVS